MSMVTRLVIGFETSERMPSTAATNEYPALGVLGAVQHKIPSRFAEGVKSKVIEQSLVELRLVDAAQELLRHDLISVQIADWQRCCDSLDCSSFRQRGGPFCVRR